MKTFWFFLVLVLLFSLTPAQAQPAVDYLIRDSIKYDISSVNLNGLTDYGNLNNLLLRADSLTAGSNNQEIVIAERDEIGINFFFKDYLPYYKYVSPLKLLLVNRQGKTITLTEKIVPQLVYILFWWAIIAWILLIISIVMLIIGYRFTITTAFITTAIASVITLIAVIIYFSSPLNNSFVSAIIFILYAVSLVPLFSSDIFSDYRAKWVIVSVSISIIIQSLVWVLIFI